MSLMLYSNGILEEFMPANHTFTYDELVKTFDDYDEIKSHRLSEIPNCWVIWGELDMEEPPEQEYNRISSEIIDEDVYSHMIFVHDSELDINWGVTDSILYKPYDKYLEELGKFIKEIVNFIAAEAEREHEAEGTSSMIFLNIVGHTEDKRILYEFDPEQQNEDFEVDGWDKMSAKIFEYLKINYDKEPKEVNKPFVLYADTKVIVIAKKDKVNDIVENMLKYFGNKEDYEACSFISKVREDWYATQVVPDIKIDSSTGKEPPKKRKRGRPPKNKNNDQK